MKLYLIIEGYRQQTVFAVSREQALEIAKSLKFVTPSIYRIEQERN